MLTKKLMLEWKAQFSDDPSCQKTELPPADKFPCFSEDKGQELINFGRLSPSWRGFDEKKISREDLARIGRAIIQANDYGNSWVDIADLLEKELAHAKK